MITSKKLTNERLQEIKDFPITYNEDSPKLSPEEIAQFKPAHPEYFKTTPIKVPVSIKIDADVLAWFKSQGKGYQTRMNEALRNTMVHAQEMQA